MSMWYSLAGPNTLEVFLRTQSSRFLRFRRTGSAFGMLPSFSPAYFNFDLNDPFSVSKPFLFSWDMVYVSLVVCSSDSEEKKRP